MYLAYNGPPGFSFGCFCNTGQPINVNLVEQNASSCAIVGATRVGKTNLQQCIANEFARHGVNYLFIDPGGGVRGEGVKEVTLSDGPEGDISIPILSPSKPMFDKYGQEGVIDLSVATIESMGRKLGGAQEDILRRAIRIVWDREDAEEPYSDSDSKNATMRHLMNVLEEMYADCQTARQREVVDNVIGKIARLEGRNVFSHENQLRVSDLLNESVKIDASGLTDLTCGPVISILLSMLFHELMARGEVEENGSAWMPPNRLAIIVDEASTVTEVSEEGGGGRRILEEIATKGRKYGISLVVSSQMVGDLPDKVINNAGILIAMSGNDAKERKKVMDKFGLPGDLAKTSLPKGVGAVRLSTGEYFLVSPPYTPKLGSYDRGL